MSRLLPRDLDEVTPVTHGITESGFPYIGIVIRDPDWTGAHLPELKATHDAPSLYPHAPKRTQSD